MLLSNLCDIHTGISFRSRIEPSEKGATLLIQMKDLTADNTVCPDDAFRISLDPGSIKDRYLLKKSDIVFRTRGQQTTGAILKENSSVPMVLAAPLLRIRVTNPELVLPEYLLWHINRKKAQLFFSRRVRGVTLKSISKHAVSELPVPLPELSVQKKVVDLFRLSEQEKKIMDKIKKQRAAYVNYHVNQLITGDTI